MPRAADGLRSRLLRRRRLGRNTRPAPAVLFLNAEIVVHLDRAHAGEIPALPLLGAVSRRARAAEQRKREQCPPHGSGVSSTWGTGRFSQYSFQ